MQGRPLKERQTGRQTDQRQTSETDNSENKKPKHDSTQLKAAHESENTYQGGLSGQVEAKLFSIHKEQKRKLD